MNLVLRPTLAPGARRRAFAPCYNVRTFALAIGVFMSPQDIERTIEFILQTQARTASQMDRFQEELRGFQEELRGFHEELREQKASISGLAEISRNSMEHNSRMEEIAHSIAQILALQSIRLDRLEGQI